MISLAGLCISANSVKTLSRIQLWIKYCHDVPIMTISSRNNRRPIEAFSLGSSHFMGVLFQLPERPTSL